MQSSSARSCCGSSAAGLPNLTLNGKDETEIHILTSCQVCPAIPAKAMPPSGVLCKHLDDMLKYFGASASVSLTDLLLMAGDPAPTPGFHMLVQYVATLCHLHSVPKVQFQL